jgi:hypothetical protein
MASALFPPDEYHCQLGELCPHARKKLKMNLTCGFTLGCASCLPMIEEEAARRANPTLCFTRYASDSLTCARCPKAFECACEQGNPRALDIPVHPIKIRVENASLETGDGIPAL